MKIVIIRHADPDFERAKLTKEGEIEAKLLGEYYSDKDFDYIYCSPLNRAKLTCKAVIKKKKIIYKDYLKEFIHPFKYKGNLHENWDFLPSEIYPDFKSIYNLDNYLDNKYLKQVNIKEKYNTIVKEFDKTLESHGYKRLKNGLYKVTKPNKDRLVFFCHFGTMSILLSRLCNIPFMVITQYFCCLPSGVTTLYSEERRKGIAQFRMINYGSTTHLAIKNKEPSFSARFCELYTDKTRHD